MMQAWSLDLYLKKGSSTVVFLWILWNFKELPSYQTPSGDWFWISKAMFKVWLIFHIQKLWYSFTRGNSFLQTLSQSFTRKKKNSFLSTSRQVNNVIALTWIFSSILNCIKTNQKNSIIKGWKYRSKGLLKAIPLSSKK